MTKASPRRVTRRTGAKKRTKSSAKKAADGNGQTKAVSPMLPGIVPPKRTSVGKANPADTKKLKEAERALLKQLAEVGDLTLQIEMAQQRRTQLGEIVRRMRQDFQAMMRGVIISNGFDPDKERFFIDFDTGQIDRVDDE